tara:strand:+ start:13732 stop:14658 length:927 start_codon:yes stop_codon:yes gene_type:complete
MLKSNQIKKILSGEDSRLIIICGPCSIHDQASALDYARRLKDLSEKVSDKIYIAMRFHLEKPRSIFGWKGYAYADPVSNRHMGIKEIISFLKKVSEIGIPLSTEILNPNFFNEVADFYALGIIGARTVESQIHREYASSLQIPIGFKNSKCGNYKNAINAMISSRNPQEYFLNSGEDELKISKSQGNKSSFLVLRGGREPNYNYKHILEARKLLKENDLSSSIFVDCSHGNSNYISGKQIEVTKQAIRESFLERRLIKGILLESNINSGNQDIHKKELYYGVSVTDDCISWEDTENLIMEIYNEMESI